jgi:hypothetical protein
LTHDADAASSTGAGAAGGVGCGSVAAVLGLAAGFAFAAVPGLGAVAGFAAASDRVLGGVSGVSGIARSCHVAVANRPHNPCIPKAFALRDNPRARPPQIFTLGAL